MNKTIKIANIYCPFCGNTGTQEFEIPPITLEESSLNKKWHDCNVINSMIYGGTKNNMIKTNEEIKEKQRVINENAWEIQGALKADMIIDLLLEVRTLLNEEKKEREFKERNAPKSKYL
jgi:hypothetical protein